MDVFKSNLKGEKIHSVEKGIDCVDKLKLIQIKFMWTINIGMDIACWA